MLVEENEVSLGEELGKAWDEAVDVTPPKDEPPADDLPPDDVEDAEVIDDLPPAASTDAPPDNKEPPAPPPPKEPEEKVPASWGASVREKWATLPPEVRQEINKRERDFALGMQKNAEAARYAHHVWNTLNPVRPFFAANGMDENRGLQELVQTAATLFGGAPHHKAQAVANIIKQYGVDVQIVDSLLVGEELPPEARHADIIQQEIQKAVAPYQQFVQQIQQRQQAQQQQVQQGVMSEVEVFAADPKNEFYREVRMDMADILDLAAKRGVNMTLKEAYDRACLVHPEISKTLEQRRKRRSPERRAAAASSVAGAPAGAPPSSGAASLRDALDAAWENSAAR
jgi:hypothetical protein